MANYLYTELLTVPWNQGICDKFYPVIVFSWVLATLISAIFLKKECKDGQASEEFRRFECLQTFVLKLKMDPKNLTLTSGFGAGYQWLPSGLLKMPSAG